MQPTRQYTKRPTQARGSRDVEADCLAHDGRPHRDKLHFLSAGETGRLYPELPAFRAIRAEMDPEGMFTSDYLTRLGLVRDRSAPAC